jgi:hypothetical protein
MKHIAWVVCAAAVSAAQLSSPVIGYVRTTTNELRPLLGVKGAFVLGKVLERDVLSAAFTSTTGLAKKDSEVLLFRGGTLVSRHSAPAGTATFRFTVEGEPASVRFETGECLEWSLGTFQPALPSACVDHPEMEQVADEWFAGRADGRILLKRGDETWQLPE